MKFGPPFLPNPNSPKLWDRPPIVDGVDNARALVLEATTLYASVNVLLYFILHSDTAHAWGVDRKGAALKDNFVKLFIIPHYDSSGLIIRSLTKGVIRFVGEDIDRPARLFTTPPVGLGKPVVIRPPMVGPLTGSCPVCGEDVTGNKIYCSNRCKQAAYRQRAN